jgi:hypothetical protein
MRLRKLGLIAASLAVSAGFMFVSSDLAGAVGTTFRGSLQGQLSGSIVFSPALTDTASSVPITITISGSISNLSSGRGLTQGGVRITGGKMSSSVTIPAGSTCDAIDAGVPASVNKFTYKSRPKGSAIAVSHFISRSDYWVSTSPLALQLGGVAGSHTTGSFTGRGAGYNHADLTLDQSLATLQAACAGAGLSSLSFTGVNGLSNFSIG